jgi:hypothetical protein
MTRWRVHLIGMFAAGAIGASASGQPAECAPCRAERVMQGVPANCEAVLVVSEGSRQFKSRPGRALATALMGSGAMPETMRAWGGLAATLEWTRGETFDELLGRKFTLVMRGLESPGGPDWALVTEVSPEAEARLRTRLKAAPRGNIAGLAVLAVEDGRYELVVGRGNPGATAEEPATATVLLGPGGANPLFTELAPSLLTRTGLAAPSRTWRAGQRDRECDLVFMLRTGAAGRERTLSLRAAMDAGGWEANVVCSPGLVWDGSVERIRPWSDAPFRALERDAILAVMGPGGAGPLNGEGFLGRFTGLPAAPVSWLAGLPEGRLGGLFIHPAKSRVRQSAKPREPNPVLIMADSHVIRQVRNDDGGDVALLGQWCVTLAMEAGARADAGRLALRTLTAIQNGGVPLDGQGELPEEDPGRFQSVALSDTVQVHADVRPRMTRLSGEEPVLSWGDRPAAQAPVAKGGALAGAVGGRAAEPPRGWSVMSISPGGTPMAERDAAALGGAVGGTSRARISIGMVRPEALSSVLGREDPILPLWARGVESLRWDAFVREDGMVEATIGLKMAR